MRGLILVAILITCQLIAGQTIVADDGQSKSETITIVHYPINGTASGFSKHMVRLLGREAVLVELPEQNLVLIRVPVDQQEQVSKLIQAVDVPRPMVRYRLYWIHTKNTLSPGQAATLSGPESAVKKVIDDLGAGGEIVQQSVFEASSLSNTECMITKSGRESVVTGTTQTKGGQQVRSSQYVETGTTIRMRGLATQSSVLVDLDVERSTPGKAGDNEAVADGEQSTTFQSTLQIKDGNAQVVSSMAEESDAKQKNLYVILSVSTQ